MKKPFNTLSKAAFATVLATSALTPVVAQAAENNNSIEQYIFQTADGQLATIGLQDYQLALAANKITPKDIKFITFGDKNYKLEDYKLALAAKKGNISEAIETLSTNNSEVQDLKVVEGEIKDGKVVAKDETLEEKVNETFFYNLAA